MPVLALACLVLFAPPAAAAVCVAQNGYGYDVEVTIELPEVRLDRSLSRAQLGGMALHGPDERVLGLTKSNLEVATLATYLTYPAESGLCFWVGRIGVMLRYHSLDVYVAREYRSDSCAYRAILEHEKQHVAIARRNIQRYLPRIKSALASLIIPKARTPKLVASMAAGEADMERILDKLMTPIQNEIDAVLTREQAKIDTPESYARVRAKCSDW
ncbi:MAG: hypothetical protein OEM59_13490 [Rhodospirillales bacterium]|nr:hypothetical protein [Rhodospirillales bacterium]